MEKHITSQHTDLKWERLRLQYLRKCRRTLYTELLATDKLNEHLGEINEQADSMFSQLVKQLAEQQGITEALKAENQLLWVQQILKILFASLSLILSLFVWLCAGLLSCSGFVFKLASGLLSLLAFAVLITYSVKNGIILLMLAFLISPMGLPMLAVWGLGKLQDMNTAMKNFIHS